jgi:hypothetical protein
MNGIDYGKNYPESEPRRVCILGKYLQREVFEMMLQTVQHNFTLSPADKDNHKDIP